MKQFKLNILPLLQDAGRSPAVEPVRVGGSAGDMPRLLFDCLKRGPASVPAEPLHLAH